MRRLVLGLLVAVGLLSACGPQEDQGVDPLAPRPVAQAKQPLALVSKGGLAFVRLDGVAATAEATKGSGLVGLWSGYKLGAYDYPFMAVQGPSVADSRPSAGTMLTYEWTGTDFAMRGKFIEPWGEPGDAYNSRLPTFQGATHIAAIPDEYRGPRNVFLYDAYSGKAEIWTYGYNTDTGRFSGSLVPYGRKFNGLAKWDTVTGYPRGVLFFNKTTREVWRGAFDGTGIFFKFAPLPALPSHAPHTDVTYVPGYGHLFYDRAGGYAEFVRYDASTDTIVSSSEFSWVGPGYDKMVGTGNGQVFFFDSTYGRGLTFDVITHAQIPQSGFTRDWTAITAVQ